MIAAVFDSGALDGLLDDRTRRLFVEAFRDTRSRMLVPAVVVTEFLSGHPREPERAHRVLNVFDDPVVIDGAVAARAADLRLTAIRQSGRDPGIVDAIVAAIGEAHGAVVTDDRQDFEALAASGHGFAIFDLGELAALLSPRKAKPRRRPGRRRR